MPKSSFPKLTRTRLETLQVNLTLKCNQACVHCHVDAGPKRTEAMSHDTIEQIITFIDSENIKTLDITGGAPELHPDFRYLVRAARARDVVVIDRCNLTILFESGQDDLAEFLAEQQVNIVASLPCYLEDNVDAQRGKGVFEKSIRALQILNDYGFARDDQIQTLDLVYNPQGPVLPPEQSALEQQYKAQLLEQYGIKFNHLFVLCNMPINRFAHQLHREQQYESYISLLKQSCNDDNIESVMCRSLLSIDWQGYVYDCDFNQMLNLPLADEKRVHLSEISNGYLSNRDIAVRDHCFACTAGQGSSCGGACSRGEFIDHYSGIKRSRHYRGKPATTSAAL